MRMTVRIQTVSQWYLLKQINQYLGKRKIPEEVMRCILRIRHAKQLGKDGFLIICLNKIRDDCVEMGDIVNLYPYRRHLEEDIDEIKIRTKKGNYRNWYITHAKIKGQDTKIEILYTTNESY